MATKLDLEKLECHFKWKPEEGDVDGHPEKIIPHIESTLDEFPDTKLLKLNLISYLCIHSEPPEYSRGLAICDDVMNMCEKTHDKRQEEYRGYEIVATGNIINLLLRKNGDDDPDAKQLYDSIPEFDSLPDVTKATILGCHAFALTHFGPNNFPKSIELFQECFRLDPNQYCWPLGIAFSAGRMRRVVEGVRTSATDMEESCLRQAIEISQWKKALPIAMLAEVVFVKGRSFKREEPNEDPELMEEAKSLIRKAYKLAPHSPHVLKRSGKIFQILIDEHVAMTMMNEAVNLNPHSSHAMFRLGQLYQHGKELNDPQKAEECFVKAIALGRRRNFFAESQLGWLRNKRDRTYDILKHFEEMRIHYAHDEFKLDSINKQIEKIKDYRQKRMESQMNYLGGSRGGNRGDYRGSSRGGFRGGYRGNRGGTRGDHRGSDRGGTRGVYRGNRGGARGYYNRSDRETDGEKREQNNQNFRECRRETSRPNITVTSCNEIVEDSQHGDRGSVLAIIKIGNNRAPNRAPYRNRGGRAGFRDRLPGKRDAIPNAVKSIDVNAPGDKDNLPTPRMTKNVQDSTEG